MVPTAYVAVERMPLTDNGKVDRRALAAITPASTKRRAPARDSAEGQIAALWCEVLEIDQVDADDNFFELGGHSLLVLPLRERLEKLFDRQVSPVDLFRYPTVAALARHLGGNGQAKEPARKRKGGARTRRQQEGFRALKKSRGGSG